MIEYKSHRTLSCLCKLAITTSLITTPLTTVSAQIDRSAPPVLGAPRPISLPPISERTLANGIKLMVVERHELPIVDIVMIVKGSGATANPADRAGLSDLTSQMIMLGTKKRTALEIDDQIAYLGISLTAGSGWDGTTLSLTSPTDKLDSALELMSDVLQNPSFPVDEFERLKKERLTYLLQLKDRPSAIADVAFQAILFGADHPYGRHPMGSETSIEAITVDATKWFYETYYAPNNSTIIAVGDITLDQLEAKINATLGRWGQKTVPAHPVPTANQVAKTTIYLIDKPQAAQSSFRIGSIGVARSTPDFFPLEVVNTILGGSFTSRLNLNLRETKGFTYGAGSRFDMRSSPGPFVARSEIISAMSDSALVEFIKELTAIRDTVPSDELNKAKQNLELALPSSFETTSDVARRVAVIALHGLPLDYYNGYSKNIRAVSQADVQRVAQKYIDPTRLVIVIVGDKATIEPTIRALNVAPVEIRGLNGALLSN